MALFRIHRMKDPARQQFRWAPHVPGCASVKPKDFEQRGEIEALDEYDAWRAMRGSDDHLLVGDLLETPEGHLRICKYVGFEPAQWALPEAPAKAEPPAAPETAQPSAG